MLLYQAGPATQDIFETLKDTRDDYATAKIKLLLTKKKRRL